MQKEEISTEKLLQIIQEQIKVVDTQSQEIKYLKEKLDYFMRQKFCSSSEKLTDGQLSLFDEDIENNSNEKDKEEMIKIEYERKKGGRKLPPKHLDRVRVEHDITDEEKICSCGCQRVVIKEIITEQYDIIPAKFQVIQNVRFVYGCFSKCGAKLVTAPLPAQVLPQSQITPSFLATIAVQKFEDSLPLYRQAKIFKNRFGVKFTTTTLSNWIIKSSQLVLKPFIEKLNGYMIKSDYIHVDETTLQVLKEPIDTDDPSKGNRKATKKSYIWLRATSNNNRHKIVLMDYSATRANSTPKRLFEGFSGYIHTDGYAGYNIVSNKEDVIQLACWAHARRKFTDIIKSGVSTMVSKKLANEAILLIKRLYKIESDIKDKSIEEKYTIRNNESKLIIDEIKLWLDTNFFKAQQMNGVISKAFVYLNNQFSKLSVYLKDGKLDIDNNKAENHIRPIAIGRKNWLFATSTKGANALVNWYSIIETAKSNNLDPYKYLCYILKLLPIYKFENKDIDDLLPWNVELS